MGWPSFWLQYREIAVFALSCGSLGSKVVSLDWFCDSLGSPILTWEFHPPTWSPPHWYHYWNYGKPWAPRIKADRKSCGVSSTENVSEDSRSEKCLHYVSVNPELPWFKYHIVVGSVFITWTPPPVFIHVGSLIISTPQTHQIHVWAFIPRK